MSKACPKCQLPNANDRSACSRCGHPLPGDKPESAAASQTPPAVATHSDHPEQQLWQGRASYQSQLHLAALHAAITLAALVLYFACRDRCHGLARDGLNALVLLAIVPPAIWLGVKTLVRRWIVGYRLTDQRLFIDRGILSRLSDQIELVRVDDVRVRQNLFQRILKLGDVIVLSTDESHGQLAIRDIRQPHEVCEQVRAHVRRLRQRSLYVESL